jgi:hypothetical protein
MGQMQASLAAAASRSGLAGAVELGRYNLLHILKAVLGQQRHVDNRRMGLTLHCGSVIAAMPAPRVPSHGWSAFSSISDGAVPIYFMQEGKQ